MKQFDLNFIKFDRLFQSEVYRDVYNKSKDFEYVLPVGIHIGDVYLRNFVNYSPTSDNKKFLPNSYCQLGILIGCKESLSKLSLYFHFMSLVNSQYISSFDIQNIYNLEFTSKNKFNNRYNTNQEYLYTFDNISGYRDSFKNMILDYIDENKIFDKLVPVENELNKIYSI